MDFENSFPSLPTLHDFDPYTHGHEFCWFRDADGKIVALPFNFVKEKSASIKEKLKEPEDVSELKTVPLILTIHTEDENDSNERHFNGVPLIGEPISSTLEETSDCDVDLGEYPCVKASWYIAHPKTGCLVDEDCIVDTKVLSTDLKSFLKRQAIPLQEFAVNVLRRTQGTLSDLVNHPRAWPLLTEKGRSEYVIMIGFLAASNLREIVIALRRRHSENLNFQSSPKPRILTATFVNMISEGMMPSNNDIQNESKSFALSYKMLVQYCKDQSMIARLQSNNEEIDFNDQLSYFDEVSKEYLCPYFKCGSILGSKASLRGHCRSHKFSCDKCKDSFNHIEALDRHKSIHHLDQRKNDGSSEELEFGHKFQCGACSASFKSRGKMAYHVTEVHQAQKLTRGMMCHVCFNHFKTVSLLTCHMRSHTNQRPYKCEQCDKTFQTKGNLQRHMHTHLNLKPFKCDICDARFTEARSVKVHMRIHNNDRPFKCSHCNKSFTQSPALKRHVNAMHSETVKHICELCGAQFVQRYNLNMHLMAHKGVKRFKCEQCGHQFSKKSDLKRHHLTHTGDQPFKCSVCTQGFTRLEYLKKHVSRDHPTNIFECMMCKKSFNDDITSYTQHMKTHEAEQQVIIQTEPRFTNYRSTTTDMNIQCVNGLQITSEPSNTVFMSTGQIFNGQKQFLITTVPNLNEVDISNGLGTSGSDTSMMYDTSSTAGDQHSLILQAVGMPGTLTTDNNSADALLFTEVRSSDNALSPIVGLPMDNEMQQTREGMVESSDPNMHSVIVDDHDVMMTHNDITRAVTMTMRNML